MIDKAGWSELSYIAMGANANSMEAKYFGGGVGDEAVVLGGEIPVWSDFVGGYDGLTTELREVGNVFEGAVGWDPGELTGNGMAVI